MLHGKKIAFCTYVSDELYNSIGAAKLVKSAEYFHPDIPMFAFGNAEIEEIKAQYGVDFGLLHPFFIHRVMKQGYDVVIHLDADSMLAGPLHELFNALDKYEIVCVRNNNDWDRAGSDNPITYQNIPFDQYVNGGLVATHNEGFIKYWMECNQRFGKDLPFMEQDVLNQILQCFRYFDSYLSNYIVDNKDSGVYYGVSSLFGGQSHWDSWKQIALDEQKQLILNGKVVKILHHAGGFRPEKLDFNMFSPEVAEHLLTIISS